MIHLSRFVSADSVLPIRLYRFSSIDSVLLIYFCRFTYINLLMLICFTQFTSADSHSYNAMLSTLCFRLCRGYITAFCCRYRIPFDFISRNSMRQTPGRRNSRRFPDAHTGRLDSRSGFRFPSLPKSRREFHRIRPWAASPKPSPRGRQ